MVALALCDSKPIASYRISIFDLGRVRLPGLFQVSCRLKKKKIGWVYGLIVQAADEVCDFERTLRKFMREAKGALLLDRNNTQSENHPEVALIVRHQSIAEVKRGSADEQIRKRDHDPIHPGFSVDPAAIWPISRVKGSVGIAAKKVSR